MFIPMSHTKRRSTDTGPDEHHRSQALNGGIGQPQSTMAKTRQNNSRKSLHVPIMPIEVEPTSDDVGAMAMQSGKMSLKRPRRLSVHPMLTSQAIDMKTPSSCDLSSPTRPMTSNRGVQSLKSMMRHRVRTKLNDDGFDLEDLNVPGDGKFAVFFAGGSVTVRGWATGDESSLAIKYLCLKAFGSLDLANERDLVDVAPQFLEWPSAQDFQSRVGAKTMLDNTPLHAGCILEIRNPKWLDGIREGRKRAMLEAELAPMSRMQLFKRSAHLLLNEPSSSLAATIIAYFVLSLILLSTVTLVLETMPQLYAGGHTFSVWFYIEAFCIAVFSIELVARFLVCPDKVAFMTNGMNLIDLIAISPFYVEVPLMIFAAGVEIPGLAVLRVTRLARVLRLFKVSQGPLQILSLTIKESLRPMYSLAVITCIAAVMFAALMYYAERGTFNQLTGNWERTVGHLCRVPCTDEVIAKAEATLDLFDGCRGGEQPFVDVAVNEIRPLLPWSAGPGVNCSPIRERSPYDSIPAACWWSVVTMTTLGYGDYTPITMAGKIVGMVTMLSGTLVIALPVTVIGQNFSNVYGHVLEVQKRQAEIEQRKRELAQEALSVTAQIDEYRAKAFRVVSKGAKSFRHDSQFSRPLTSVSRFFSTVVSNASNVYGSKLSNEDYPQSPTTPLHTRGDDAPDDLHIQAISSGRSGRSVDFLTQQSRKDSPSVSQRLDSGGDSAEAPVQQSPEGTKSILKTQSTMSKDPANRQTTEPASPVKTNLLPHHEQPTSSGQPKGTILKHRTAAHTTRAAVTMEDGGSSNDTPLGLDGRRVTDIRREVQDTLRSNRGVRRVPGKSASSEVVLTRIPSM